VAWRLGCLLAARSDAETPGRWAPGAVPRDAFRSAEEDASRGAGARSAVAQIELQATRRAAAAQEWRGGRV